jgi:hypothetical protein
MAKFIRVKGLRDGDVVDNPKTMTIPDEKLHLYVNCDWYKSGKWIQIIEEKQEERIEVKAKIVDTPVEHIKRIIHEKEEEKTNVETKVRKGRPKKLN